MRLEAIYDRFVTTKDFFDNSRIAIPNEIAAIVGTGNNILTLTENLQLKTKSRIKKLKKETYSPKKFASLMSVVVLQWPQYRDS